jgi:hypothetical protein
VDLGEICRIMLLLKGNYTRLFMECCYISGKLITVHYFKNYEFFWVAKLHDNFVKIYYCHRVWSQMYTKSMSYTYL